MDGTRAVTKVVSGGDGSANSFATIRIKLRHPMLAEARTRSRQSASSCGIRCRRKRELFRDNPHQAAASDAGGSANSFATVRIKLRHPMLAEARTRSRQSASSCGIRCWRKRELVRDCPHQAAASGGDGSANSFASEQGAKA